MGNSASKWIGIIVTITGAIVTGIGIYLLEQSNSKGEPQKAINWVVFVLGLILLVIGIIVIAFAFRPKAKVEVLQPPPQNYGTITTVA